MIAYDVKLGLQTDKQYIFLSFSTTDCPFCQLSHTIKCSEDFNPRFIAEYTSSPRNRVLGFNHQDAETDLYQPSSHFYYPVGNTHAICLTQDIPPEQKRRYLTLGMW